MLRRRLHCGARLRPGRARRDQRGAAAAERGGGGRALPGAPACLAGGLGERSCSLRRARGSLATLRHAGTAPALTGIVRCKRLMISYAWSRSSDRCSHCIPSHPTLPTTPCIAGAAPLPHRRRAGRGADGWHRSGDGQGPGAGAGGSAEAARQARAPRAAVHRRPLQLCPQNQAAHVLQHRPGWCHQRSSSASLRCTGLGEVERMQREHQLRAALQ